MTSHLGGHNNITHTDSGVLKYFYNKLNCKSMLDVGCGPAGNVFIARSIGYNAIGIDGDKTLVEDQRELNIIIHDYTEGKLPTHLYWTINFSILKPPELNVDLIYSTEFLEHVEEKYLDNVFDTFSMGKYICITHALPHETGGHHHVNCQSEQYWIDKFDQYGFDFSPSHTGQIRVASTMSRNFMSNTGKVFVKR